MGGLVASGDETAVGNPNEVEAVAGKPKFPLAVVGGGGLEASPDPDGGAPPLSSAQRGHFLLVSANWNFEN
jgi:hypothetical protein